MLVLVERAGPVWTVSINRPDKRNCVNAATAAELTAAFAEFEADAEANGS